MSLGNYVLGDPALLTITFEHPSYKPGDVMVAHLNAHHPKLRGVKVRLYQPDAEVSLPTAQFPRAGLVDTNGATLRQGAGRVRLRIGPRQKPGLYQVVVNMKKEAWIDPAINGAVWLATVEVVT